MFSIEAIVAPEAFGMGQDPVVVPSAEEFAARETVEACQIAIVAALGMLVAAATPEMIAPEAVAIMAHLAGS